MNLCSRVPHASKKSALDKHRQTERALCTFMKGFEGRTALLRASGGVGEALPRDAGMSIDLGNEKKLNDILGESRQEPTHISVRVTTCKPRWRDVPQKGPPRPRLTN